MKIIVGELSGFCDGVNYTINKAKEILMKENSKVYCLGEIVHNEGVVQSLENKGMITVESIEQIPNNSKAIFRAHGEPREVYDKAKSKDVEIIDLTCGKVRIIHNKVEKECKNAYIIIIGKKTHPETIGTKGFAGKNSFVVENKEDILLAYNKYIKSNLKKVYIVEQTTFSVAKFHILKNEIEKVFSEAEVIVDNTICDATEKRQNEVKKIANKVDKMIVIGGKQSSNTKELANIAKLYCEQVYTIQSIEDLPKDVLKIEDIVGIVTGTSTPKEIAYKLREKLESMFNKKGEE